MATLDLRGFGGSSARWNDYSAQAVAGDLLKLESHLAQKKAVFVGDSFAAGAAVWAAHEAPERAIALVLLGPVLRDPSTPSPWYERIGIDLMFLGPWRVHFWLQYWDSLFPTRKPPDQAAYRLALKRDLQEPHRMAALKTMLGLSKAATAEILHEVKTPTLLVMGSEDPDFDDPTGEARWASRNIGAQDVIVQGAGHYPHVEMPEQVGPAIVGFLQDRR